MAIKIFIRPLFSSFPTFFVFLFLAGCAGQRPPEGGPVDLSPPEISSVYPEPNTVRFSGNHFSLEFNKYVDHRSVEESIFISPYAGDLEFDWSGREVEATFPSSLKKSTTYVITVGTDVVDLNNHNRMASAYTLAFSTGGAIDSGKIEGRVFDEKPEGVMIFAYRLNDLNPDTLNPMALKPDYITQTGKEGTYSLSHLAMGNYRLVAVRDEYRNLLYDPETDAAGLLPADVTLTAKDTLRAGMNFQLEIEDTTAPRLLSAQSSNVHHVVLKFSESLDTSSVLPRDFSIADTLSGSPLHVENVFVNLSSPSSVTLLTDAQKDSAAYLILVNGVKDLAGHTINEKAHSYVFLGSARVDTLPPHLVFATIADSNYVARQDEHPRFDFDNALQPLPVRGAFRLFGKDSSAVPYAVTWNTAASFNLVPDKPLLPNERYTAMMRYDSLRSPLGSHWVDSVQRFTFRTIDPEQLSSIEGTVVDADTLLADRYIVEAKNISDAKQKPVHVRTERGKTFLLPELLEGKYTLMAFQDVNDNGKYDAGKPFPFLAAERFAVYPDTIKVRARWPVDGVVIRLAPLTGLK
ncbi:MAG: Ig-like domain-containing protein [Bacteroidota bacterium]|nr:Ig-like domain-containing protein [Bacteroidota bacterium]